MLLKINLPVIQDTLFQFSIHDISLLLLSELSGETMRCENVLWSQQVTRHSRQLVAYVLHGIYQQRRKNGFLSGSEHKSKLMGKRTTSRPVDGVIKI